MNPNTRDLEGLYWTGETYEEVHEKLVEQALQEVRNGPGVALVTYGHPLIFDSVSLKLLSLARKRGMSVNVVPAVSCVDTVCIDLGIDYSNGLQLFDADDLVDRSLPMNSRLETLVLHLGNFETLRTEREFCWSPGHFQPLVEHLGNFYSLNHRAVIVFSSDGEDPSILIRTQIGKIDSHRRQIFPGCTLYLPPQEE